MLNNDDYLKIFHEIKNSITLIGSSLQLLEKKHPEVKDFEYWSEAMNDIQFLKNMVTELSASRIDEKLHITPVSLEKFLGELEDSLRSLSWKHFYCKFSIESDLPSVEFDSSRMKQAIINLLKNAYEAMLANPANPDSSEIGTVNVHVFQKNQQLYINVIDCGGGLDPSCSENLFQSTTTTKEYGSGLGLLITRQIIEAHHGTLSYESRPGDGCTFTIQLPFKQN